MLTRISCLLSFVSFVHMFVCLSVHHKKKQTSGEMGNWKIVWWQVVSKIFVPKIIKIW